ncbi:hypothetical protein HHI36_009441 [Cryptolaemus montrouzieri]|uniref:Uncharacterized protein n=1 Tax=Cryptolaemus montrouzieri TaxID=559131 RepID=A0ABD2MG91_9CUCU
MEIEEKAKDFIEKFHNLEGILLKERKKSLFLLLHKNISLKHNEQVLQKINELLQPKSHLEEIYKLEFLIYFKRASDLLDILRSGNVLIANKIMRQPWFLKENFRKIEPKEFVQDIFPQLSVVIRAKILKQMLKHFKGNEKFMESLFDEILETYGLEPALIIMSGCTIDKIKEILSCRKLNISKAQLKLLHDKDPSLISFYFEECYRRGGDMSKLGDFLVYLSKKDANLHVSLLLKYKVGYYNLGRRTARKYVAENKESILKEPQTYVDVIQFEKQICFKELGDEFPILFKAIFPKHLSILWYHQVKYLLNSYPKNKRYELYFNTFQHVYGKSLFEAKTHMFKELLDVIQDEDEREKWVEIFDSEDYIKYKRSSVAIAELKERLVRCDDNYFRRKLFEDIVDVCSLNKDYDELLSILKLFCYRFRNTDDIIIYAFLNSIYRSITLEKLKEEHWKYIHEIIMIQNIRQLNLHTRIIFEYTIYLFKSGNHSKN